MCSASADTWSATSSERPRGQRPANAPFRRVGGGLEEICTYVEKVGMTEAAALLTATRDATRVIGFGADAGTLEPGRFADLLVLRADPLRDIRVIPDDTAREAVVQCGRVVAGALPAAVPSRP